MSKTGAVVGVLLGLAHARHAATVQEVMFSRYMRYQFCMEAAYGQGVYGKLKLEAVASKWGPSEPTLSSLAKQPLAVRKVDAECRRANELTDQPRPP